MGQVAFTNFASATIATAVVNVGDTTWALAAVANNLSDLVSAATARTNLGLGTSATHATGDFFLVANNLSEGVAATMRTSLGLGSIATQAANSVAITGGTISGVTFSTDTY